MDTDRPQSFKVVRETDVSGVSGAGHVADGVIFSDGTTVLRWRTGTRSTGVYSSFEDMRQIHGHGDATKFVFDTQPQRVDLASVEFRDAVVKIVGSELRRASFSGAWLRSV